MSDQGDLQELAERWTDGEPGALDRIVELLYDDLRAIAHRHLRSERAGHTLTATALVHEAYVRLSEGTSPTWQGRPQFFALASRLMRHVLIDHARRRDADKRGGKSVHVPIDESRVGTGEDMSERLSLDEALVQLEERDERLVRVVECRFFSGMPEAEIADTLGVSTRTVQRDWKRARAYLSTVLTEQPSGIPSASHRSPLSS